MVLLPATDERGAQSMQERILSLLELNNQYYPGHTIQVSMGICLRSGRRVHGSRGASRGSGDVRTKSVFTRQKSTDGLAQPEISWLEWASFGLHSTRQMGRTPLMAAPSAGQDEPPR